MKKLFTLLFVAIGFSASAQYVGVNTTSPKATLDIVGSPATVTANDGILVPKLTKTQLGAKTGYNATHSGTVVFVTDATGAATATTANVSQVGHYVFNGTTWAFLGLPSGTQSRVSNVVAADVAVTLGNISIRVPSAGNKSIQLSTTTSFPVVASSLGLNHTASGDRKAVSIGSPTTVAANTWTYFDSALSMTLSGAAQEVTFLNTDAKESYRVTVIAGNPAGNAGYSITIERIN